MRLPKIPYTMDKDQSVQIPFRGINYSDMLTDGDVADSSGISMRRYPFLTTRRGREKDAANSYDGTEKMFSYSGKIATVRDDGKLYKNGTDTGHTVGKGARFAKINSKLVSFGVDAEKKKVLKKYYDTNKEFKDPVSGELEAEVYLKNAKFETNAIIATEGWEECHVLFEDATISDKTLGFYKSYKLSNMFAVNPGYYFKVIRVATDVTFDSSENGDEFITAIAYTEEIHNTLKALEGYHIYLDGSATTCEITQVGDAIYGVGGDYFMLHYSASEAINGKYDIYRAATSDDIPYGEKLNTMLSAGYYAFFGNIASAFSIENVNETSFSVINKSSVEIDVIERFKVIDIAISVAHRSDFEMVYDVRYEDTLLIVGDGYTGSIVGKGYYPPSITFDTNFETNKYIYIKNTVVYKKISNTDSFEQLKKGDAVTVSGIEVEELKKNNTTFIVFKKKPGVLFASSDIFEVLQEETVLSNITISRKVPDLDFICESENRLWGCNSAENTVYVSALGDPTNMYAYEGVSTDSFATAVGSEGDFTGCCKYGSSVLFFKEDRIHKFLGSYPAEYTLYSYEVDGVQAGSEKSLVVINEVLYYKGLHGVYAYDGGVPRLISECFGDRSFYNAVAGTDGVNYYISMNDNKDVNQGQWYLFVYNTRTGMWVLEDHIQSRDFARVGRTLYYLGDGGNVWSLDNGCTVDKEVEIVDKEVETVDKEVETVDKEVETVDKEVETVDKEVKTVDKPIEWMVQFTPFYETIEGRKSYSRILMRAEVPLGSYIELKIRCDDGRWAELGRIVGKMRGVVPIRIPINRCDKFELRLEGKGECTIHSMLREYYVGGVR